MDRTGTRVRGQQGFTLIELLIVIVILAILAAIVVFAVGTTTTNAVQASCQSDAKSVETALEAYKAQTGNYPAPGATTSIQTFYSPLTSGTGNGGSPWLRSAPTNTAHYTILYDSLGHVYVLGANASLSTAYTSATDFDTAANACSVAT